MSRRMPLDAASDAEDNGGMVRRCVPASFDPSLARVAPHRARGRSSTCRRRDRDAAVTFHRMSVSASAGTTRARAHAEAHEPTTTRVRRLTRTS
jgi:hypothetical protein